MGAILCVCEREWMSVCVYLFMCGEQVRVYVCVYMVNGCMSVCVYICEWVGECVW